MPVCLPIFRSLTHVHLRYYSPYPLIETEPDDSAASSSSHSHQKIPGVARTTSRSHGRTSDLLAGGLGRHHSGEATLWVCHFCFKYMADGIPWESHKVGLWLYFPCSSANTPLYFTRKTVKLRALQVQRFTNGVHTLYGRLMVQKRRLLDFMTISPPMPLTSRLLALLSESFALW